MGGKELEIEKIANSHCLKGIGGMGQSLEGEVKSRDRFFALFRFVVVVFK